ncbi:uncharacterized protein LOC144198874 [Stigmatopora nigra]
MLSLKGFLEDRLSTLAEEIFDFVETRIDEYKMELCHVIDLEVGHLRSQLQHLLQSDSCYGAQLQEHIQHLLPAPPSEDKVYPEFQQMKDETSSGIAHSDDTKQPTENPGRDPSKNSPGHGSEPRAAPDWETKERPALPKGTVGWASKERPASLPNVKVPVLPSDLKPEPADNYKPYICSVCDKGYEKYSQLERHLKLHTGEKPCSCTLCNKSFWNQADLDRHMTFHSTIKPFVCNYCNRAYKRGDSLKRHKRYKHSFERSTKKPS